MRQSKWCKVDFLGTFHSTKNSKNFETGTNGANIPTKKNHNTAEFPKRKPFNQKFQNSGGKSDETEIIAGNQFQTILEFLARLYSFPEISENAVPFVARIVFHQEISGNLNRNFSTNGLSTPQI